MNKTSVLESLIQTVTQQGKPADDLLFGVLSDTMLRRELLTYPQVVETLRQAAILRSGVNCAAVEDELAELLSIEEDDSAAVGRAQQLMLHVQLCPWCAELYGTAQNVSAAQTSGRLAPWPITAAKRPRGAAPALPVIVSQIELKRVLGKIRQQAPAWRSGASRTDPKRRSEAPMPDPIVYAGILPNQPDLFVDITLSNAGDTINPILHLIVKLKGTGPYENRGVILQHEAETRTARTDSSGQARFVDVPPAWLDDASVSDLLVFVTPL